MNNVRMVEIKTKRLDMRIPETLKNESIAVAKIERRSLSNLIEVLLQEAVDQKKATDPRRFKEELLVVMRTEANGAEIVNGKGLAPKSRKKTPGNKEKEKTADSKAA